MSLNIRELVLSRSLLPFFAGSLLAQGMPSLVKDIVTDPAPSYDFGHIEAAVVSGAFTFFLADDGGAATHLWKTNGLSANTTLLRTIPGWNSRRTAEMVAANGLVFFTGPDQGQGEELWVSDGTAAGTVQIDCAPGPASSQPIGLTAHTDAGGTAVFFSATTSTNGRELWRSTGTAAGTQLWRDSRVGSLDGMSTGTGQIASTSGGVLFAADNGSTGRELWRWDGNFNTVLNYFSWNLNPGSASSNPHEFVGTGDDVMCVATGPNGTEPYHIHSTPSNSSVNVVDVRPGANSSMAENLVVYVPLSGAKLFFFAANGGNGIGNELWRYNTGTGSLASVDLVPGATSSNPVLTVLGNRILAVAGASGARFLSSVGTTTLAVETLIASDVVAVHLSFSSPLAALVHTASFPAYALYYTQGTAASTAVHLSQFASVPRPVAPINSGSKVLLSDGSILDDTRPTPGVVPLVPPIGLTVGSGITTIASVAPDVVVFDVKQGNQLSVWRSDGTAAGTFALGPSVTLPGPINQGFTGFSPQFQGKRYFVLGSSAAPFDLFATDGTVAGTTLIRANLSPAAASSVIVAASYAVLGSKLLVFCGDSVWATEGTTATTVLLHSGNLPTLFYLGHTIAPLATLVVFTATTAAQGNELWSTNGTAAGTALVRDIYPGSISGVSIFTPLVARSSQNDILFAANNGTHGVELWRTAGSFSSTFMLKDINPGSADSSVSLLSRSGDAHVLMSANDGVHGPEAWVSDGTSTGTVMLVDATPGASGSLVTVAGQVSGATVFGAGLQLWETQGTSVSTSSLATFAEAVRVERGVSIGNQLLFPLVAQNTGSLVLQPWRTNGTTAGTLRLQDIEAGRFFSLGGANKVLFAGGSHVTGNEVWTSNGTVAGTTLHANLAADARDSYPNLWTLSGGNIFFVADDGIHGGELFVMTSMAAVVNYGLACTGANLTLPQIFATTPVLGSTFDVTLRGALPNTFGALLLGFAPAEQPLGGGCTQLISTGAPNVSLFTGVNNAGSATVSTFIPLDPTLSGLSLYCQYGVLDPAGAFQNLAAFSGGLQGILAIE